MKSLSNHSAFADTNLGVSPKLKPFNVLTAKLSSASLRGLLGFAVAVGVLSIATEAQASYMARGAVGPAVADVQAALGIPVDGVFGCQTQNAVMDFQYQNGLLVDGVVGPETWSALFGTSVGFVADFGGDIPSDAVPVGAPIANNILEPGIKPPSSVLPPAVTGPYVVVIPGADPARLAAVQQVVPNSVVDGAPQGTFINAGGYPNYSSAREVAGRLRGFGFDARVDYFRRYREADGVIAPDGSTSSGFVTSPTTSGYTPFQ